MASGRRRRTFAIAAVACVAALAIAAWILASGGARDPYAAFHQVRSQAIPGTFGYTLEPAEGAPRISPDRAYERLMGAGAERDVALTYAVVRIDGSGSALGPAWVYLTHDLCYFTAKGDLVSPGRSGQGDGCTPDNILVQVVDATTGRFVAAFTAYDVGGEWRPARAGNPQDSPTTRFH
jgi:hypothetical protein